MLNELLLVERGAEASGLAVPRRHPDIKIARRLPSLIVRLDATGRIAAVRLVPRDVALWTLRDGNHNSFPVTQPGQPLCSIPADAGRRVTGADRARGGRRRALLDLIERAEVNTGLLRRWPGSGLLRRLRERRAQLGAFEGTDAVVLVASIDRFAAACDPSTGEGAVDLIRGIRDALGAQLAQSADEYWVEVAMALLVEGEASLVLDADGCSPSVIASSVADAVSDALRTQTTQHALGAARCALTGEPTALVPDKFPQPNLPLLGQTYLFSRNKDAPTSERYGLQAAASMPVGVDVSMRLAGALTALTSANQRGKTWRAIPGVTPKQNDLLLAFVRDARAIDLGVIDLIADDEADWAEEASDGSDHQLRSIAAYEERCQRVVRAWEGDANAALRSPLVQMIVLRRVDPANRKAVYEGVVAVDRLYDAATAWAAGERNFPSWLDLPLPVAGKQPRYTRRVLPPHVAPLGLIGFTRSLFTRGGADSQEVVGLSATDALRVFFATDGATDHGTKSHLRRTLRLVLARRAALVRGVAHALRGERQAPRDLNVREALRTITILGVLLSKLGRRTGGHLSPDGYMSGPAFVFGQMLAVADVMHLGYCMDVRRGQVPPSLLGNQVFATAQNAPVKALAMLSQRWKPYAGWAKRSAKHPMPDRFKKEGRWLGLDEVASKDRDELHKHLAIIGALKAARRLPALATQLEGKLPAYSDDVFRAELLLGYMAGPPKTAQDVNGKMSDEATVHATHDEE